MQARWSGLVVLGTLVLAVAAGEAWLTYEYGIALPWETPRLIRACGLEYDYVSSPFGTYPLPGLVVVPVLFNVPAPIVAPSSLNGGLPYNGCPPWIAISSWSGVATYLPSVAP